MSIPFNLPNAPVIFSHSACTGGGPHPDAPEVRILHDLQGQWKRPLCRACFDREIAWRAARNRDLADDAYATPAWESLLISIDARPS